MVANAAKVFIGYPHRSTSQRDMEDIISRLLPATRIPQENVVQRIKTLAESAIETNRAFLAAKIPTRVSTWSIFPTADSLSSQVSEFICN